jgi:hypothetical protein
MNPGAALVLKVGTCGNVLAPFCAVDNLLKFDNAATVPAFHVADSSLNGPTQLLSL